MAQTPMKLEKVQQWVISALVFAIGSFPMGGLIVASNIIYRQGREGAAIGMCVMSGVIGIATVGGMLLLHKRSPLSPYLLLGLIPAVATGVGLQAA